MTGRKLPLFGPSSRLYPTLLAWIAIEGTRRETNPRTIKGMKLTGSRRKGRQGPRQGRRQAPPQDPARQHPGHHEAGHPPPRAPRRRQAHLGHDLRGDALRAQDVPRERHPRRRHVHGARQAQDGDVARRGVRAQEAGPHPLRFRRLSPNPDRVFEANDGLFAFLCFSFLCLWQHGKGSLF